MDDTDLVLSSFDSTETLDDMTPRMYQSINTWEGGLRATGGAMVPEKRWVYPMKHSWTAKGEAQLDSLSQFDDIQFQVKDAHQNIKPF